MNIQVAAQNTDGTGPITITIRDEADEANGAAVQFIVSRVIQVTAGNANGATIAPYPTIGEIRAALQILQTLQTLQPLQPLQTLQ